MMAFHAYRILLTTTLLVVLLHASTSDAKLGLPTAKKNGESQLSRLFDYEHYKKIYNKKYSNAAEDLSRKKIFLAKAFRALVSGIAYKFRKSSYYLALSPMSDRTKEEMDATHMNPRYLEVPPKRPKRKQSLANDSELAVDSLDVIKTGVKNLKDLATERRETEILKELNRLQGSSFGGRSKRSTKRATREKFSFNQIFDRSMKPELSRKASAKLSRNPKGNNPKYESPDVSSLGYKSTFKFMNRKFKKTVDNLIGIDSHSHTRHRRHRNVDILYGVSDSVTDWINYDDSKTSHRNEDDSGEDKVFIDHSNDGCMYSPGAQRQCGSCYAFAVSGYFEWLYCKKRGYLVPFSEQYIVDCGPEFFRGDMSGCHGGYLTTTARFFQNHGAELSTRYPYRAMEGQCPYNEYSQDKMGFIRFHGTPSKYVRVPLESWYYYLEYGPMVLTISSDGDFNEYGGGVHPASNCCTTEHCGPHAVLLIGHGREDGQTYWLIKNSYGPAWGDKGYYKLSKKSDCIHGDVGLMFGTDDAVNFELETSSSGPIPRY